MKRLLSLFKRQKFQMDEMGEFEVNEELMDELNEISGGVSPEDSEDEGDSSLTNFACSKE